MRQIHSPYSYPESAYDHHLCLKAPLMLWVVALYLSRAVVLPMVAAIGAFAGVDSAALALVRRLWNANTLAPSLIALLVVVALILRVPKAPRLIRWIWAHGRILLAIAAGADLAMLLLTSLRQLELNDDVLVSLMLGVVDVYFLLYALLARRVRDTFAEFPPPQIAGK